MVVLVPVQPVAAISAGRYGLVQEMASPDLKAPGFGWLRDSTFAMLTVCVDFVVVIETPADTTVADRTFH